MATSIGGIDIDGAWDSFLEKGTITTDKIIEFTNNRSYKMSETTDTFNYIFFIIYMSNLLNFDRDIFLCINDINSEVDEKGQKKVLDYLSYKFKEKQLCIITSNEYLDELLKSSQ